MTRPLRAWIDLQALGANLQRVRECAPRSKVLAVIKANAYGHGLVRVAEALPQADAFGVASIDEAMVLRESGIRQPIVLLEGFFSAGELVPICRQGLTIVVHHEAQVQALERAELPAPVAVWIKIDTGMHRLGFRPERLPEIYRRLEACRQIQRPVTLMSHLANADDREDALTGRQIEAFDRACAGLAGPRSIANSGGLLGWLEAQVDWVRPGIMLYGISPFKGDVGERQGLRPVMTLESQVIAVQRCREGEAIGYGGSWVCPEDMPVATVAIGYGDGYPRHVAADTPVLVAGQRLPIIGRVSMDMLCVDLRARPDTQVGEPVILWGRGLPVEEIAQRAGTIAYDLLCRVSQRVRFVEV